MTGPAFTRSAAAASAIAVVVAAVLLADTLAGVPLEVAVSAVVVLALAVVVVALRGVEDLAVGLLVVAVGTATWNGLSGGGLQIAHVALAAAVVLLLAVAVVERRRVAVPPWVAVLAVAVLLAAAASAFWPPDPGYLAARFEGPAPAAVADAVPEPGVLNLFNAVRWLIAVIALPSATCLALVRYPRLVGVLASAWALGATANALVALSDAAGFTVVSLRLLGTVDIGGRQAGLTEQPNHLALAVALAAPVVTWKILSSRYRGAWLAVGGVLTGGLVVSQSRGGLVAAAIGVAVVLMTQAAGRRVVPALAGVAVSTAVLLVAAAPDYLDRTGEMLRLSGADSAQESDAIRSQIGEQALADGVHSPWHGIGLGVITEGHNIYLQLLAAGGALLVVGFVVAMAGFFADAWQMRHAEGGVAGILLVSTGVWLAVGAVENQLTDVFLYVPFALVAGLWASRRIAVAAAAELVAVGPGGPP